ncbi:hypothetical protein NDN08_002808 [Rhodosorus marinus]|uniref:Uncharacterized protein n=1 Tax=Rhodosorus marinus TaxID=101924 RepID=A0AAV8UUS6_9RHOD|nr:hypothetical protein NDN08_002808 [Rhodosorus marinus]
MGYFTNILGADIYKNRSRGILLVFCSVAVSVKVMNLFQEENELNGLIREIPFKERLLEERKQAFLEATGKRWPSPEERRENAKQRDLAPLRTP